VTDVAVFFIAPTGRSMRSLRRYAPDGACPDCGTGRHDASTDLDSVVSDGPFDVSRAPTHLERTLYAARWPTKCSGCDYEFREEDAWQIFSSREYASADGRAFVGLHRLPVGACYDARWYPKKGPDGRRLIVMTPGGLWDIDSRASNCTMPHDDAHQCWVRRGKPEDGTLHVDKSGLTCAAGAGSIQFPNWHGFLHNGRLSENG